MNIKTAEDRLNRYIPAKGTVDDAIDEYEAIQSSIFALNQSLGSDTVSTGTQRDKMEKSIVALGMLAGSFLERAGRLQAIVDETERIIDSVKEVNFWWGAVLEKKYVYGKTHEEIASSIGYATDYITDLKRFGLETAVRIMEERE